MRTGRPVAKIELSAELASILEGYTHRRKTAQALAVRARIVLGCASGLSNKAVAARERVTAQTVGKWRRRFLERTQPLLPMRPGQVERRSHDYERHGTTSLFAALDIATGHVIGRCYQRHRAVEFRKFLTEVEQAVPADLDIHLVLDNYATHKAPPVKAWLARHPRYHLHFTPTSASWLNQVERWFALLGDKQIKRGVHRSIRDLKADIATFIQVHNADPKPFIWTKTADAILQTIARYCSDTLAIQTATY
jgi:transposase